MDKGLFANDGSFMERFKQMQQEKEKAAATAAGSSSVAPKPVIPKQPVVVAANKRPLEVKKAGPVGSGGKLAFSLKKAKVAVAPVFAPDEDEDAAEVKREEPAKRQKSVQAYNPAAAAPTGAVAPPPPNDMTVRQVADKLACFVAKNGRQFENITRQRNPGDTPFKFLFDKTCPDYKYDEFRLAEEEKVLPQPKEAEASKNADTSFASSKAPSGSHRSSFEQKSNYQIPASALYGVTVDGSTAYVPGQADEEDEDDDDDDAEQDVSTEFSPLSFGSLKRSSSTSTTGNSLAKKSKSPMVNIFQNFLDLNRKLAEQRLSLMQRQAAAAKEEERIMKEQESWLSNAKRMALEAGVRKGSKEWLAIGVLSTDTVMRELFLDCETVEARLKFIKHYMKLNHLD